MGPYQYELYVCLKLYQMPKYLLPSAGSFSFAGSQPLIRIDRLVIPLRRSLSPANEKKTFICVLNGFAVNKIFLKV